MFVILYCVDFSASSFFTFLGDLMFSYVRPVVGSAGLTRKIFYVFNIDEQVSL